METLVFQLYAPLSAWGDVAVGEYRPTANYPGRSAVLGLVGAALGITRDDDSAQAALRDQLRIVVGLLAEGRLLRDYHTAQVPGRADLKKRPHASRKDELSIPKRDLNTILSTRDYRQDAASLIALQLASDAAPYTLSQIAEALKRPKYVLYLGRKSCPPALPLHPCLFQDVDIKTSFLSYQEQLRQQYKEKGGGDVSTLQPLRRIAWGDDAQALQIVGVAQDLSVPRKDQVITRSGWLFSDRTEHIAIINKE
ncbi:type I-E CRISPR-associated protein Cas5/CasD [Oxalobacteraceae bacterium A2-2]